MTTAAVEVAVKLSVAGVTWQLAKLRHTMRQRYGEYQLEWMREPPESFRLRPERCANPRCRIRLNMPGVAGFCSAVCKAAIDGEMLSRGWRPR